MLYNRDGLIITFILVLFLSLVVFAASGGGSGVVRVIAGDNISITNNPYVYPQVNFNASADFNSIYLGGDVNEADLNLKYVKTDGTNELNIGNDFNMIDSDNNVVITYDDDQLDDLVLPSLGSLLRGSKYFDSEGRTIGEIGVASGAGLNFPVIALDGNSDLYEGAFIFLVEGPENPKVQLGTGNVEFGASPGTFNGTIAPDFSIYNDVFGGTLLKVEADSNSIDFGSSEFGSTNVYHFKGTPDNEEDMLNIDTSRRTFTFEDADIFLNDSNITSDLNSIILAQGVLQAGAAAVLNGDANLTTSGSTTTVTTSNDAFANLIVGSILNANGSKRRVQTVSDPNQVIVDANINWEGPGGAGYDFTYENPVFRIYGTSDQIVGVQDGLGRYIGLMTEDSTAPLMNFFAPTDFGGYFGDIIRVNNSPFGDVFVVNWAGNVRSGGTGNPAASIHIAGNSAAGFLYETDPLGTLVQFNNNTGEINIDPFSFGGEVTFQDFVNFDKNVTFDENVFVAEDVNAESFCFEDGSGCIENNFEDDINTWINDKTWNSTDFNSVYKNTDTDTNAWTEGLLDDNNIFQVDVNTTGNVKAGSNIYVNADGGNGDSFVYFYDDGSETNESFKWDDASDQFETTNDLFINGSLDTDDGVIFTPTDSDDRLELQLKPMDASEYGSGSPVYSRNRNRPYISISNLLGNEFIDFQIDEASGMGTDMRVRKVDIWLDSINNTSYVTNTLFYQIDQAGNTPVYSQLTTDCGNGSNGFEICTLYNSTGIDLNSDGLNYVQIELVQNTNHAIRVHAINVEYEWIEN